MSVILTLSLDIMIWYGFQWLCAIYNMLYSQKKMTLTRQDMVLLAKSLALHSMPSFGGHVALGDLSVYCEFARAPIHSTIHPYVEELGFLGVVVFAQLCRKLRA